MISFEQLVERTKASNAVYRELLSNRVSSGEESDGVHFFEKEFTYTCHGPQAHAIASRFYSTSNVIKQDQGVDTIEVGSKMFATIMQALLLDRIRVNIWAKGEDYWRIVKTATPGDWSQVESLMAESDTFRPCFAALVICEDVGNDATIGFAALSTSDCSLTLYHPFGLSSIARYIISSTFVLLFLFVH